MEYSFLKTAKLSLFLLPAFIIITSCKSNDEQIRNSSPLLPVETDKPNTDYKPAFEGQTRVKGTTPSEFKMEILATSLNAPWGIAALPDGRLLITEKAGTMRIVNASGVVSDAITGIPSVNASGQGGLLGLCLDPSFANNRMVYWVFAEAVNGGNVTAVAKGRLSNSETTFENATVIYRTSPANESNLHYGGRILFDKTGNLIVSTGERSVKEMRPLAQSVTASLGKMIRITTNGQPAAGNPTFSQAGALPELYSIGQRNPQGIAFHPVTGDLWQNEFGPRGGDEINIIKPGLNYGWPTISYGLEYGGGKIGSGITQKEGMEQPVYYWDPVISPSGMTFYAGNKIPEWQNNLFVGALSGQHIARLVIENNRVVAEERLLVKENQRFRDVIQGTDGALYAVTDQGKLYKLDKK